MKTHVFHLQVIVVKDIFTHEVCDIKRSKPLMEKIKKEQYLSNPILVALMGHNQYLQLDGMNRLCAFRALNIPYILAQIVDYNDQESVELSSWVHLFYAMGKTFLSRIEKLGFIIKKGRMDNVGHRYIKEEGPGRLCTVIDKEKNIYLINSNGNIYKKVNQLSKITSFYRERIVRDILPPDTHEGDVDMLFKAHTDTNMLVVFPTFTRHQIIDVVKNNVVFPPGITRHIIKRRCLNMNIPLEFFNQKKSCEALNVQLENILLKRPFRIYEEPTIYFE